MFLIVWPSEDPCSVSVPQAPSFSPFFHLFCSYPKTPVMNITCYYVKFSIANCMKEFYIFILKI